MALLSLENLSSQDFKSFLNSFDTVVTDCDCVLWIDDCSLPGSPEVINTFKGMGKTIVYMTNNSTKTREQLLDKCLKLGYNAEKVEIIGTAYTAANYLKQMNFSGKAYVVGSQAVHDELALVGIESLGPGPDLMPCDMRTFVQDELKLEDNVGAVIVGYDEHISYPKLAKAFNYLRNPRCLFIATNNDPTKKVKNPELKVPGAGTFVNMLRACVLKEPVYMGKPHEFMQQTILANPKVDPKRTLMIGDKPSTDMLVGKRCGFATLMVLSGSTTLEQVKGWQGGGDATLSEMVPDYYVSTLGALLPLIT